MKKLFASIALAVALFALPLYAGPAQYFTQFANTVAFANPTTSSSNTALSAATFTGPAATLRIVNATDKTVFVKQGTDNTVAAAATSFPVASGQTAFMSADNTLRYVAVYAAAASSGSVYITLGIGY